MAVLKLDRDDEDREMEFELDYQMSLTFEQRYRMMEEASRYLITMLEKHEERKPFEIIKRP
jgi:hypothetical protein